MSEERAHWWADKFRADHLAAVERATLAEQKVARVEAALAYISSPTMGLPGGRDALDFVDEASEQNAREALKACIRTARAALADPEAGR